MEFLDAKNKVSGSLLAVALGIASAAFMMWSAFASDSWRSLLSTELDPKSTLGAKAVHTANAFIAAELSIDPEAYDTVGVTTFPALTIVSFDQKRDFLDVNQSFRAASPAVWVFLSVSDNAVLGYQMPQMTPAPTALSEGVAKNAKDLAESIDAIYGGRDLPHFIADFDVAAYDFGGVISVEIAATPQKPGNPRIGGGLEFFVLRATGEIVGVMSDF